MVLWAWVGWCVVYRLACLIGVRLWDAVADPQGITAPILVWGNKRDHPFLDRSLGYDGFEDNVGVVVGHMRCDLETTLGEYVKEGEEEV